MKKLSARVEEESNRLQSRRDLLTGSFRMIEVCETLLESGPAPRSTFTDNLLKLLDGWTSDIDDEDLSLVKTCLKEAILQIRDKYQKRLRDLLPPEERK